MPYFISVTVMVSMMFLLLNQSSGIVNIMLGRLMGIKLIPFMQSSRWFRTMFTASSLWRTLGYGSVLYIAVLSAAEPQALEAPAASTATPPASQPALTSQPATEAPDLGYSINKDTWPIVNDPITLKIMGPKGALHIDWKDMDLFIWLTEKTNILFEFNTPPVESFSERKTLAFASGDLPDLFLGGSFTGDEVIRYGVQQELIVRFEDYKDYAPNIFHAYSDYPGIYAMQLCENGYSYSSGYIANTFCMPTIRHLFVNSVWMEKVGKTMPTTIDEYLKLLRSFKEGGDLNGNGENDELVLGYSSSAGDLSSIRSSILGAFGILTDTFEIERGTTM